ncbi:MAG: hypothetical protein F4X97_02390 [Boseongicola sp. SB0662_bin_57]|nr:hypothetical protein [Boseongicola sp. SB0662_bin_57]
MTSVAPACSCGAVAEFGRDVLACLAAAAVQAALEIASAGTDTTFDAPLDTVEDIVGGTGGKLATVLVVGTALVGAVLRFSAMQLLGAARHVIPRRTWRSRRASATASGWCPA